MSIRYRAYQCKGNPDEVVTQISSLVRGARIQRQVPRICLEKSLSGRHIEFYVFVGYVPGEDAELDEQRLNDFFAQVERLRSIRTCSGDVAREEIARVVGRDYQVREFARRLCIRCPPAVDPADPFGEEAEDAAAYDELEETARLDKLLLWLSAWGEGSHHSLEAARVALGVAQESRRILRHLRLLGHIETSQDGRRWSVAPSVLVETERETYVLCGARDASLMEELRERAMVEGVLQPGGAGPSQVRISTHSPGDLDGLALTVGGDVGLRLARALPPISEWPRLLESFPIDVRGMVTRRWKGNEWESVAFVGDRGFYQLEHPSGRRLHAYYSPELGWRRGEWFGLQFLARLDEAGAAPCLFDATSERLAVPLTWRWPELYERCLVLTSGKLPRRDGDWFIYESVEEALLEELKAKLSLEVGEW